MNPQYSPLGVFIVAFIVSCLSGVAAFLRSNKKINWLSVTTAGLNSGLLGLSICLIWYDKFKENIHFLMGMCVLTGLTGAAGLELVLSMLQKGGFSIQIGGGKDKDGNMGMSFINKIKGEGEEKENDKSE